jgi:hypothetical protein
MRSPDCAECARLRGITGLFLSTYRATFDVFALTPNLDVAYTDRWSKLKGLSVRLFAVQNIEQLHHDSHQGPLVPVVTTDAVRDRAAAEPRGNPQRAEGHW